MLDKLPAWVRHLLIVLAVTVLTTVGNVIASHQSGGGTPTTTDYAWGIGAGLVTQLLLWLTPLTTQYGVGSPTGGGEVAAPPPGD